MPMISDLTHHLRYYAVSCPSHLIQADQTSLKGTQHEILDEVDLHESIRGEPV